MIGRLESAIALAAIAHAGQPDKSGTPYILHPLRVMLAMQTDEERIVAVLHDVAEDCKTGWPAIKKLRLGGEIEAAIDAITRRPDETYVDYISRLSANALARRVKLADLDDNLLPSRAAAIPPHLIQRYERARVFLQEPCP